MWFSCLNHFEKFLFWIVAGVYDFLCVSMASHTGVWLKKKVRLLFFWLSCIIILNSLFNFCLLLNCACFHIFYVLFLIKFCLKLLHLILCMVCSRSLLPLSFCMHCIRSVGQVVVVQGVGLYFTIHIQTKLRTGACQDQNFNHPAIFQITWPISWVHLYFLHFVAFLCSLTLFMQLLCRTQSMCHAHL